MPIGDKKYVILSVSEISHNLSEKYMPVSSSVGFFTSFRKTYFLVIAKERSDCGNPLE